MLITETFHGYIETTQDALLVFEGCRRGLLPRICRRLQERERKMIRSGSIFIFDERESGIKRWTDGRVWSPSRILGNFLIYRELDKKSSSSGQQQQQPPQPVLPRMDRKERQLVGSLSDSYRFKHDGLIKKTMSIIVNGVAQHLISYYDPQQVMEEKLRTPSSVPELASLEISPELLARQNFRVPPLVEPTFDPNNGNHSEMGMSDTSSFDRRMHPLRSMSVGSLGHSGIPPEPYYARVTDPSSRGATSTINNGMPFSNMFNEQPSPLSSSPSTPMLASNTRNSYQHHRHYSASSLPRYDPRMYSIDNRSEQQHTPANIGQLLNPVNHHHQQGNENNDLMYQRSSLTNGEMPLPF